MPQLTIHSVRVRAVNVPLVRLILTSSGTIPSSPVVLIDMLTNEGITGHSYLFTYTPVALQPVALLISNLATALVGDAVAPVGIEQKLQQFFRLLGPQMLTGMTSEQHIYVRRLGWKNALIVPFPWKERT